MAATVLNMLRGKFKLSITHFGPFMPATPDEKSPGSNNIKQSYDFNIIVPSTNLSLFSKAWEGRTLDDHSCATVNIITRRASTTSVSFVGSSLNRYILFPGDVKRIQINYFSSEAPISNISNHKTENPNQPSCTRPKPAVAQK